MKPKFRAFLLGTTLLASPSAQAITYYWDNLAGAGFGTAGGTWSATTAAGIPGWNTDATGAAVPASVDTLTTDAINFGTATAGQGLAAGTIMVTATVAAGNITFGSQSGAIVLSGGTINLAAAATIVVSNPTDTISSELSGAATSLATGGIGTLVLNGLNTFTGPVTLGNNAGSLLKVQIRSTPSKMWERELLRWAHQPPRPTASSKSAPLPITRLWSSSAPQPPPPRIVRCGSAAPAPVRAAPSS